MEWLSDCMSNITSEFSIKHFELSNPKAVSDGLLMCADEAKAFFDDVLPHLESKECEKGVDR
jgi:hypothetical protein